MGKPTAGANLSAKPESERPPDLVTLCTDTAFQQEKCHSPIHRMWTNALHHL